MATMLGRFFEQGGDAWIDLPTNFTSLPAFGEAGDVAALLDHDLPIEKAAALLHEMTHHWCFTTPLGITLTLLRARIQENLVRFLMKEDVNQYDILDDVIRYQTAAELLRPLAEGLALFAEHDAVLEGRFCYSAPLRNMLVLGRSFLPTPDPAANRPLVLFQEDVDRAFAAGLDAFRRSAHGIDRKADLLASPLDFSKSVYLGGYLAVRNLWTMTYAATDGLTTDKFLSYCRTYFFSDYGLVHAILAEGNEATLFVRIGGYVRERIKQLSASDLGEPLAAWDAHDEGTRPEQLLTLSVDGKVTSTLGPPALPGLLTDPDAECAGHRLLAQEIERLDHSELDNDVVRGLRFSVVTRLALRYLMPITSLPVMVKDDRPEVAVARTGDGFGPFRPVGATIRPGNYMLEYFRLPSGQPASKLVVLMADDRVAAVLNEEEEEETSLLDFVLPHMLSSERYHESLRAMREFEAQTLDSEDFEVVEYLISAYGMRELLPRNMHVIYEPLASRIFRGDDWKEHTLRMSERGFFDLFDGDYAFLLNLAAFSVWASRLEKIEVVRSGMGLGEDAWQCFLDRLKVEEARLNARLLFQVDDVIGSLV